MTIEDKSDSFYLGLKVGDVYKEGDIVYRVVRSAHEDLENGWAGLVITVVVYPVDPELLVG